MILLKNISKNFTAQDTVTEENVETGIKMFALDGICSTAMTTLQGGVYLTAYALLIGATQKQIGLIASIGFISQFMQLAGLFILTKYSNRKLITAFIALTSRLLWIPIIILTFSGFKQVNGFLLLLLAISLLGSMAGPAFNSMLRDLFPQNRMGYINSRRLIFSTGTGLILMLLGGYFIDSWSNYFPSKAVCGYGILFSTGLIFGIYGISAITRIPQVKMGNIETSIIKLIIKPLKDKNFRMLLGFLASWNFAVNLSLPFFIVFLLERIHMSLFMITIYIVIGQIFNLLFFKTWGKLSDRFSNKTVLAVSGPLFVLSIAMWIFTTNPETHKYTYVLLALIYILNGISFAGVSVAVANIGMKLSPEGEAYGYLTLASIISAFFGAIAPIIGGIIADLLKNTLLEIPIIVTTGNISKHIDIITLKGLDFLFIISLILGLYAMHRLVIVKESGEKPKKNVIDGLTTSIIVPLRSISSFSGIHRLTIMPLSNLIHRRKN